MSSDALEATKAFEAQFENHGDAPHYRRSGKRSRLNHVQMEFYPSPTHCSNKEITEM
jgi:hypothetical protein